MKNYSSVVTHKKELGLSILELLVAVSIGLFLLSGIATSYVTSVKSNSNRNQASMLEDNARLALEVITKSLRHAGYADGKAIEHRFIENKADIVQETCGSSSLKNVLATSIFPANPTFDVKDSANNEIGDRITTVYYGDNRLNTDCSGGLALPLSCRLEAGNGMDVAKIYNSFYLDKSNDSLMCSGSRDATEQVVAEGVENIQILYGIDSGGGIGNTLKQDRFVNAKELFKAGNDLLNSVVSIQVAILVRSLLPVNTVAEKKKFKLLDIEYESPKDRYRREVFTTTIRLPNTL